MLQLRCQSMLPNHMQCSNDAWGSVNEEDLCRLHFSYALAAIEDVTNPLFEFKVVDPMNQPDLDVMLKQRIEAKSAAEARLKEAKL